MRIYINSTNSAPFATAFSCQLNHGPLTGGAVSQFDLEVTLNGLGGCTPDLFVFVMARIVG
jgi:hypothetical protein